MSGLTSEGRSAFDELSADEQRIVSYLLGLDGDWPFTGEDIATMILAGEHRSTLALETPHA